MNTLGINITHAVRRVAVVTIVGALALSFAAIVTLSTGANVTVGDIFSWLGDYITEMGETLGSG